MMRFIGWSLDSSRRPRGGEGKTEMDVAAYLYFDTDEEFSDNSVFAQVSSDILDITSDDVLPCPEPAGPLPSEKGLENAARSARLMLNEGVTRIS